MDDTLGNPIDTAIFGFASTTLSIYSADLLYVGTFQLRITVYYDTYIANTAEFLFQVTTSDPCPLISLTCNEDILDCSYWYEIGDYKHDEDLFDSGVTYDPN